MSQTCLRAELQFKLMYLKVLQKLSSYFVKLYLYHYKAIQKNSDLIIGNPSTHTQSYNNL